MMEDMVEREQSWPKENWSHCVAWEKEGAGPMVTARRQMNHRMMMLRQFPLLMLLLLGTVQLTQSQAVRHGGLISLLYSYTTLSHQFILHTWALKARVDGEFLQEFFGSGSISPNIRCKGLS